jgi:hypothetical protein
MTSREIEQSAPLSWAGMLRLYSVVAGIVLSCILVVPVSLLWAINGGRLLELHRDWAVIELAVNGSRRVFERRRCNAQRLLAGRSRADHQSKLSEPGLGTSIQRNTCLHAGAPIS